MSNYHPPIETNVIRESAYSWTLYVNGAPTVQRESFAVCDRVRECLLSPGSYPFSECAEVAASIRAHLAKESKP